MVIPSGHSLLLNLVEAQTGLSYCFYDHLNKPVSVRSDPFSHIQWHYYPSFVAIVHPLKETHKTLAFLNKKSPQMALLR